jgi:hypothetical protein
MYRVANIQLYSLVVLGTGAYIFLEKFRRHLQILYVRRVKCSKFRNKTHSSGVTCDPRCHLALFALCLWTDVHFFMRGGGGTVKIMPKISGVTVARTSGLPVFVAPLVLGTSYAETFLGDSRNQFAFLHKMMNTGLLPCYRHDLLM